MMRKSMENTSTKKNDKLLLFTALFLTGLLLLLKVTWLLGDTLSLYLSWAITGIALVFWIMIAVKAARRKRKRWLVTGVVMLLLVSVLPFFKIDALKFHLFQSEYETEALMIRQVVSSQEDGFYIQEPEFDSWLGKVAYFKEGENVLISFQERYTFFDCFCFVRSFSEKEVAELLNDPPKIEFLEDNWYYVNLF